MLCSPLYGSHSPPICAGLAGLIGLWILGLRRRSVSETWSFRRTWLIQAGHDGWREASDRTFKFRVRRAGDMLSMSKLSIPVIVYYLAMLTFVFLNLLSLQTVEHNYCLVVTTLHGERWDKTRFVITKVAPRRQSMPFHKVVIKFTTTTATNALTCLEPAVDHLSNSLRTLSIPIGHCSQSYVICGLLSKAFRSNVARHSHLASTIYALPHRTCYDFKTTEIGTNYEPQRFLTNSSN